MKWRKNGYIKRKLGLNQDASYLAKVYHINYLNAKHLLQLNNANRFVVSNDEIDSIKNYYKKFTKINNYNNFKDEELKIAQKYSEF